jgi:hypothetical protein
MTAPLRQLDFFARGRRAPAYPAKGRSAVEFRTHCALADMPASVNVQ